MIENTEARFLGNPTRNSCGNPGEDHHRHKNDQEPGNITQPGPLQIRYKPQRHLIVMPRGQQVSQHQAANAEGFVEEPRLGCLDNGHQDDRDNDPIRAAHPMLL